MILTGIEIEKERANGRITIEPFAPEQVNPNSYNFRLGRTLRVYRTSVLDPKVPNDFEEIEIPEEGYILEPGRLYLAHTIEVLGSEYYAPTFAARSSVARLGMFIHLSSGLGDIGYKGQWTLQLYTLNRIRVYPGMNIGQMMWWRPQGEVVLYDGKYQGASGPRSSDIHVDFEKHIARQRFPGLRSPIDPAEVGPKFANLAACSAQFSVPAAFCLPAGEFSDALTDEQAGQLAEVFADLRATVGAFYTESVARIQSIGAGITMPEKTRELVRLRFTDVFGENARVAVRSSGLDEDTAGSSLAGVHHSVLNVSGLDNVVAAIEQCWASYYEVPAVAARVRAGDHSPRPRLAVIIQAMVEPKLAGVAFTGLDPEDSGRVTVEYVEGLADGLVAGIAVPTRIDSTEVPANSVLNEVCALASELRQRQEHDVDVEWAADERGVHLIQVRPLTATNARTRHRTEPVAETFRLYYDDAHADFDLGDIADVFASYTSKRGPAYRLAEENGLAAGAGWVVRFNGLGLSDDATAAALRAELETGTAAECVLDLGETLRQIVVPKNDVLSRLAELAGGSTATRLQTAVVRDFIRGELGLISQLSEDGALVVDFTPDGLMALNRGTAGAQTIMVRGEEIVAPPGAEPLLPHLDSIARFTAAMNERYGSTTLEWVYDNEVPHFVDYSVLGEGQVVLSTTGAVQISPGTAQGPLLRLDDDELLGRLSIGPAVSIDKSTDVAEHEGLAAVIARVTESPRPPVVHVSRPYAVLSVLIGHVAGFVFDRGSTLGHLAILLREAGVPAVAVADLAGEGDALLSGGTVVVTRTKGENT